MTTANVNIEKKDKKEVEKRIPQSEVVRGRLTSSSTSPLTTSLSGIQFEIFVEVEVVEVEELVNRIGGLIEGPLVVTIDEKTLMTSLKMKSDAMAQQLKECIKADKKRLVQLRKSIRSRKHGSKRLLRADDNAFRGVLSI